MYIESNITQSQVVDVKITYNWRGARIDMLGKRYFIDAAKLLLLATKLVNFRRLLS